MTRQDLDKIRRIAKAYSENQTYTYIKENVNGRESFYNGYIIKVYDDMILFKDLKLNKEFPILFETILVIDPSRRDEVKKC